MTSRGGEEFFIAGTNRAMLRFTLMNHLCHDLEQLHDVTRVPDRPPDVSRSPAVIPPVPHRLHGLPQRYGLLAQAFAYYNYEFDADADTTGENGRIRYNAEGVTDPKTKTRVVARYHINNTTFPYGYVTTNDTWDNYWRAGQNASLGWGAGTGHGSGAAELGKELANPKPSASVRQKKSSSRCACGAWRGRLTALAGMVTTFKAEQYHLKSLFATAAVYCKGD